MIVAYRVLGRAVFLYGFAKNDRDNIGDDELRALRALGMNWLDAAADIVARAVAVGELKELENDNEEA